MKHSALLAFALLCQGVTSASAEEQELNQEVAQTIAPLFSLTVQDYYVVSRWDRPGTANIVQFRSLIPFKVWGQENLLRASIPFRTQSELGPGVDDVQLFDLLLFKMSSGFWGIGPAFNLGINRGTQSPAFQAGPAATFVITSSPRLSFGLLNQNFFSSGVAITTLQPILVFRPVPDLTLSLGELPIVYNWKSRSFAVFSVGFQVGFVARISEQPVRFFVNPQYNTKSNTKHFQWTIGTGVTLPLKSLTP